MNLCGRELDRFEHHLCRALTTLLAATPAHLSDPVKTFVLAGGKRIRPQLCIWTYRGTAGSNLPVAPREATWPPLVAMTGRPDHDRVATVTTEQVAPSRSATPPAAVAVDEKALFDLAGAWELFHAFLLAHDDVIDAADTRRGRPTLHRALAPAAAAPAFAACAAVTAPAHAAAHAPPGHGERCGHAGVSLAIVAGDLLYSAALQLLSDLDVPADAYRQVLKLFSRVALMTGAGQAIDICQSHAPADAVAEATLLREYHWKTAAYTFEGPMLSGAILAGAPADARAAISRFALALGQAYQLQNDLLDLAAEAHEGCDLLQGKRTVALLRGRSAMGPAARASFDDRLAALPTANGDGVRLAESLRRDLLAAGAAEQTRGLIGQFLAQSAAAAADPALPKPFAASMRDLLASLRGSYFAGE